MTVDPTGRAGPTRGAAACGTWRRTSRGRFVPSRTTLTVEQRIVEAWAAVPDALVTGWAALRLFGGGFFDGGAGFAEQDVPLLVDHRSRPTPPPGVAIVRCVRFPAGVRQHGVPVTTPDRSVIEAMRMSATDRDAAVIMDMAVAARIVSIAEVDRACGQLHRVRGLGRVRQGLELADAHCRSPQESRLRLMWLLDAGFPAPLMNRGIWDLSGALIGVPDLFDPEAGVAGEYDGAFHRGRSRHRRDVARWEGFRGVGIETFAVVAGDRPATVLQRMRSARSRALWLPPAAREWTLEPPGIDGPQLDQHGEIVGGSQEQVNW